MQLPASKSISNRALVLNALSGAPMRLISNLSDCDDTMVMMLALSLPPIINVGAAGTAMRFLTALLSVTPGTFTLTGTERMRHRPIGVLVDALRQLGAQVEYVGEEGFPPLRITGAALQGGRLELRGDVSSQYISALLMIGPVLQHGLTLHLTGEVVSRPYIDMTLSMMTEHGASCTWEDERTIVVHPRRYRPTPYTVEADWSAASYWYELLLLDGRPTSRLTLRGLFAKSLQGDSIVQELFRQLGVQSTFQNGAGEEPQVVLRRTGELPASVEWDFTRMPDLAQTMVVTCSMLGIPFCFRGLQSLRIKETDRIAALVTELAKLGVRLTVEGDSIIRWAGPEAQPAGDVPYLRPLPGTAINTYEDHRMAMAFAPAACVLGTIDINNPEVVSKSYPRYWEDLEKAGESARGESFICCGQHAVCEKELLMKAAAEPIDYFDDEELDRFRGRRADSYSEAEEEEFREVLYTTLTREVGDWLRSLQLRGIELPEGLRDEALMMTNPN